MTEEEKKKRARILLLKAKAARARAEAMDAEETTAEEKIEVERKPVILYLRHDETGGEQPITVTLDDPYKNPEDIRNRAKELKEQGYTVTKFEVQETPLLGKAVLGREGTRLWEEDKPIRAFTTAALTGIPRILKTVPQEFGASVRDAWRGDLPSKIDATPMLRSLAGEDSTGFGGFMTDVTEDPTLLPSMFIPGAAAKKFAPKLAPVVAGIGTKVAPYITAASSKAPTLTKVGKGIATKVAPRVGAGATEGYLSSKARGELLDQDVSSEDTQFETLLGGGLGTLGALGSKGSDIAYEQFKTLIPNVKAKMLSRSEFNERYLKDAYEQIPFRGRVDYDIRGRLDDISDQISDLGNIKSTALKDADDFIIDKVDINFGPEDLTTAEMIRSGIESSIDDKVRSVQDLLESKQMSPDYATKYLRELKRYIKNYVKESPSFNDKVSLKGFGGEGTYRNPISIDKLQTTLKDFPDDPEALQTIHSLVKMFESRKTLDDELQKTYKKLARGTEISEKEEAARATRDILNTNIQETINMLDGYLDDASSYTPEQLETLQKVVTKIRTDYDKAKELPSLYGQRDILESIGGGNVDKATPNLFGAQTLWSDIKGTILPASGIRLRQLGELSDAPVRGLVRSGAFSPDTSATRYPEYPMPIYNPPADATSTKRYNLNQLAK
jgi:hypothetical protein